ncbi:hypothetical protein FUAX_25290 [Fulvitalea axinellae]|uniref:Outer membrane protein beta-barrel domain-containing protein n=2 Tax=Fulvitalea axinellae TaxID=1182444 RepID=A0AAU9CSY3_9BACT|nr:hypothetical protein FUAX_25290 [Fulvitalea axinellae]
MLMGLAPIFGMAQKKKKSESDSLRIPKPKFWYLPSAARLGVDLTNLGSSAFNKDYMGFGVSADTDILGRFLIAGSAGYSSEEFTNSTFGYPDRDDYNRETKVRDKVSGYYYRVGADWNFAFRNKDNAVLAVGFRRGQGKFDEELDYTVQQDIWGEHTINKKSTDISASWYELNVSLKVAVWRDLFLATVMRYRFGLDTSGGSDESLNPSYVPGYGRTRESSTSAVSVSLMYRIQWKKPFKPVKKEK